MSPTQVTFSLLCGIRPRAFYAAAHAVNDSLDLTINSALATGRASMDRLANSFRVLIKRVLTLRKAPSIPYHFRSATAGMRRVNGGEPIDHV